jgi:hypothetical protein
VSGDARLCAVVLKAFGCECGQGDDERVFDHGGREVVIEHLGKTTAKRRASKGSRGAPEPSTRRAAFSAAAGPLIERNPAVTPSRNVENSRMKPPGDQTGSPFA